MDADKEESDSLKFLTLIFLVCVSFLSNAITLCIFSSILCRRKKLQLLQQKSISVAIYLNSFIWIEVVYSIFSLIYFFNIGLQAVMLEPSKQISYVLWITGIPVVVSVLLLPATLAFLTVERCFGMRFPVNSFHDWHNLLTFCYFMTLIIVTLLLSVGQVFKALPKGALTGCYAYRCIITDLGRKIYNVEMATFGILMVVTSTVLLVFIRKQLVKSRLMVRLNRLVLSSVLVIVITEFTPKLILEVSSQLSNVSILSFAPLSGIMWAITNVILAFVYRDCFNSTTVNPRELSTNNSAIRMVQMSRF
uniref:G_PROTEIN_RECEP_F1_2 domain-containing protein n=1 Tax=Panagrellus redivivus TaxID=6233 RepID=A0A7E4VZF5_PANRE